MGLGIVSRREHFFMVNGEGKERRFKGFERMAVELLK